jgi:hypothetical protein
MRVLGRRPAVAAIGQAWDGQQNLVLKLMSVEVCLM